MPSKVLTATRKGNINLLKTLITEGYPLDIKDNNGWCALHEAASRNYLECLDLLISRDSSLINSTSYDHATPLLICARNEHLECLKHLLIKGANPNICDHMGKSPLHLAASNGNVNMVVELLKSNADVNVQMYEGSTPLHEAVEKNQPDIIQHLLKHGADINIHNENDLNPFSFAAYLGLADCLTMFIKLFQESNSDIVSLINTFKGDGCTPVFAAAQSGQIDCVKILLSSGADVNMLSGHMKILPIHIALWKNYIEIVKLLLPITSLFVINGCDYNPFLFVPKKNNDTTAFNLLFQNGCSVTKISPKLFESKNFLYNLFPVLEDNRICPLTDAILMEAPPIIYDLILQKRTDFSSVEKDEFPPLLAALSTNNLSIAKELIMRGACINIYLSFPFNISLLANENHQVLEFILSLGAEVESIFSDDSVAILKEVIAETEADVKQHLELILCQSFFYCKKRIFPPGLHFLLNSKSRRIVSQIPTVLPLQELSRRVIRSNLNPKDFLNNLECLQGLLPNWLIKNSILKCTSIS